MYDNHTSQPVDIADHQWPGYVMALYDIDGFGSFFVRESPNGKTIFSVHGTGWMQGTENGRQAKALGYWLEGKALPPRELGLAV